MYLAWLAAIDHAIGALFGVRGTRVNSIEKYVQINKKLIFKEVTGGTEIDQFYTDLGETINNLKNDTITKTSLLLIAGDFDAKVGVSEGGRVDTPKLKLIPPTNEFNYGLNENS